MILGYLYAPPGYLYAPVSLCDCQLRDSEFGSVPSFLDDLGCRPVPPRLPCAAYGRLDHFEFTSVPGLLYAV